MRTRVFLGLLAALVWRATSPAEGCSFDMLPEGSLKPLHPRSLEVAIAVRDAADSDLLDPELLAVRRSDPVAYGRVVLLLKRLRGALAKDAPQSVAVLLVESGLWSRYVRGRDGWQTAIHVNGPEAGDAVVVTSAAVIDRLVRRMISAGDASDRGWLIMTGADAKPAASLFANFQPMQSPR